MDFEQLGMSGGAGFLASVLTLLGWNKRLSKLERNKQDVTLCDEKHKAVEAIKNDLDYIKARVDKIIDIQINGQHR